MSSEVTRIVLCMLSINVMILSYLTLKITIQQRHTLLLLEDIIKDRKNDKYSETLADIKNYTGGKRSKNKWVRSENWKSKKESRRK